MVERRAGTVASPRVARIVALVRNAALAALALYFLAQLAYAVQHTDRYFHDGYRLARYYAFPLLMAVLLGAALWRGSDTLKSGLASYGVVILAGLLIYELMPTFVALSRTPRSIVDVVLERQAAGERVLPAFTLSAANRWAGVATREAAVLSNVPEVETVLCSDDGRWISFRADRDGFNNPRRVARPELAVLGDSYIHGYCLPTEQTIVGQLDQRIPGTLGFGVQGNGPLYELETLEYYLPALEPPHVVWAFFEGNDLSDLELESQLPWLLEALDAPAIGYPRPEKQRSMEAVVAHLEAQLDELRPVVPIEWNRAFALLRTSQALGLHYGRAGGRLDLFERILARAQREVRSWGGTLHLLYLPELDRYTGLLPHAGAMDASKSLVTQITDRLAIPLIDAARAFDAQPDPLALFNLSHTHYTAEGARVVAETVAAALGYPPASAAGPQATASP